MQCYKYFIFNFPFQVRSLELKELYKHSGLSEEVAGVSEAVDFPQWVVMRPRCSI